MISRWLLRHLVRIDQLWPQMPKGKFTNSMIARPVRKSVIISAIVHHGPQELNGDESRFQGQDFASTAQHISPGLVRQAQRL
jgi:hypothetical protein